MSVGGLELCSKSNNRFLSALGALMRMSAGVRARTIDPVVLGDVRAYVVLVGRRAEGACEGCVFAEEV